MPFCVLLEDHCVLPIEDVIMKTLIYPALHCLVRFSEEGYEVTIATVSCPGNYQLHLQIKALPYPLKVAQIREHCKVSSAV